MTPAIDIALWSGGQFFLTHPGKVCGEPEVVTSRFGYDTAVKGDMGDVDRTIEVETPTTYPYVQSEVTAKSEMPLDESMIERAIERTEAWTPPPTDGIDLVGFDQMRQRWAPEASDEEYRAWVTYQRGRQFDSLVIGRPANGYNKFLVAEEDLPEARLRWLDAGIIAFDGTEYVPSSIYYAGNIYEQIRALDIDKDTVIKEIGQRQFDHQAERLRSSVPEMIKLTEQDESKRLFISPMDPFCSKVFIDSLRDGVPLDENTNLIGAFLAWLRIIPPDYYRFDSNGADVADLYIHGGNVRGSNIDPEIKKARKRKAQQDGLQLFQRFLYDGLTHEDQVKVQYQWNAEFNYWQEFDFSKIPLGFEINRYFGISDIDPRQALWEGVKYLGANGSGIIAYDVGVGKTMTAILCMAQAMYTGQAKRPLVVVPNPTYYKWIKETVGQFDEDGKCVFHGVLPQYKDRINDYYNLGVEHESKIMNSPPQDYTITFVTFQGLMKMGFSRNVLNEIGEELVKILLQGELSDRDEQKIREMIDKLLGKSTEGTQYNFDELGFDYIVIDEAHNFKKIFTAVKGRASEKGEKTRNSYDYSSGEPSAQGIRAFMFCNYLQRKKTGGNTCLLTATPFTNSPLEIYSMLSLVAYEKLRKRGLVSLIDFFDKFINQTEELVFNSRGSWEYRDVVKSFNNKVLLQNLIYSACIYKTGAEAGVPRPVKVVYPRETDESGVLLPESQAVRTQLMPTADQAYWLSEIFRFANEATNEIEDQLSSDYWKENAFTGEPELQGRVLIAINLAQACTLSPYLMRIKGAGGVEKRLFDAPPPTARDYIATSPKLQYVCECLRTVREWHQGRGEDVSGSVIYMNRGKEYFPLIKEYLVNEVGYADKEVEIIASGISVEKKERIKNAFLQGKVKVIIGSATIKEGIDLQVRSTVLFNCNLDWNPTDIVQVEGRIWRQGNVHSHVRIVTPLIENSMDVFLFQKLEEKTGRINDLWYRAGRSNVLNVEEFNPAELKNGLITDPGARAQNEIDAILKDLRRQTGLLSKNIELLNRAQNQVLQYLEAAPKIMDLYEKSAHTLKSKLELWASIIQDDNYEKTTREKAQRRLETVSLLLQSDESEKKAWQVIRRKARIDMEEAGSSYAWASMQALNVIRDLDSFIALKIEITGIEKNVLSPAGLTLDSDFTPLATRLSGEVVALDEKITQESSPERLKELTDKYAAEMAAAASLSRGVMDRVKEFTRHNYLLSCLKDVHECDLQSAMQIVKRSEPKAVKKPVKTQKPKPIGQLGTDQIRSGYAGASPADDELLILAEAEAEALELELQLTDFGIAA